MCLQEFGRWDVRGGAGGGESCCKKKKICDQPKVRRKILEKLIFFPLPDWLFLLLLTRIHFALRVLVKPVFNLTSRLPISFARICWKLYGGFLPLSFFLFFSFFSHLGSYFPLFPLRPYFHILERKFADS